MVAAATAALTADLAAKAARARLGHSSSMGLPFLRGLHHLASLHPGWLDFAAGSAASGLATASVAGYPSLVTTIFLTFIFVIIVLGLRGLVLASRSLEIAVRLLKATK